MVDADGFDEATQGISRTREERFGAGLAEGGIRPSVIKASQRQPSEKVCREQSSAAPRADPDVRWWQKHLSRLRTTHRLYWVRALPT